MNKHWRAGMIGAALTLYGMSGAQAQTDFSGRSMRMYIGSSAGGGYDTYGRIVARHLGRFLPGNPTFAPSNMPGAGSISLTNFLYNQAPRDGTAMAIINQSIPVDQYLDAGKANYDTAKFNWIGRASSAAEIMIVWHNTPVDKIHDVREREVIMGATAPSSSLVIMPTVLNNLAGTKFRIIPGFSGTTDIGLAMERGEVQGSGTPLESLTSYRAHWMREKKIKLLLQYTAARDPDLPDVPAMVEMGPDEEARRILGFYAFGADVGRSFVAPPEMNADVVRVLRRGFDAMIGDSQFREEAAKAGLPLKPMRGEDLQERIASLAQFPPDLLEKARKARAR